MPDYREHVREQLGGLLRVRPEREAAIVEEVAQQLEAVYEDRLSGGATESQADAAARAEIPDWRAFAARLEESQRPVDRERGVVLSGMWQDLHFGWRMVLRNPAMAASCIVMLALGIGGCTAVFSLLDATVLRPLDYRDSDRLMAVWEHNLTRGNRENVVSPANYIEWVERGRAFQSLAAYTEMRRSLTGAGDPEEITLGLPTGPYFQTLGVQPILGRDFTTEEAAPNGPLTVLLSHDLWSRKFHADGRIVGKAIRLGGNLYTVVGVLPAGFRALGKPADAYAPLQLNYAEAKGARMGRFLLVVGRLRDGVSKNDAQRELSAIAAQLETERPQTNMGWGVNIVALQDQFSSSARASLWLLSGAVLLVLLIACANVANLQLARGVQREREVAVRASLGAGRWLVIRQLLAESLVIAILGCVAGCLLAWVLVHLFREFGPLNLPRLEEAGIGLRVLAASLLLAVLTAVITGLAPALAAARRVDLAGSLKDGGRGLSGGAARHGALRAVVIAEVALALVLLTGAGLLLRSFERTLAVRPGFDPQNVLTMALNVATEKHTGIGAIPAHFREINRRVRELPGVTAASSITYLPFTGLASATRFRVDGRPEPAPGQSPVTEVRVVQPRYFETMRIPLLEGRDFTDQDMQQDRPLRFVVNETLARTMFPGESALGKRIIVSMQEENKPSEIVGVVGDVKHYSLQSAPKAMVYYPQGQLTFAFATLVIRTAGDPKGLARPVIELVRQLDPEQTVSDVRTMEEWMSRSLVTQRFTMVLLLSFAGLAVFLAMFGIYSMLSFVIGQRRHEIGIRMALGARKADIRWRFARQGLLLTATGAALGLVGALFASRWIQSFTFGIEPYDPLSIAGAALLLMAVAAVACDWPARKAASVDPMEALRSE